MPKFGQLSGGEEALLFGLSALSGLSQLQQVKKQQDEENLKKAAANALVTGQSDVVPRGGFGGLIAKTGLISPTRPAEPEEAAAGQQALQAREAQNLGEMGNLATLRTALGPAGFAGLISGQGPGAQAASRLGVTPETFAQPTPTEQTKSFEQQVKLLQLENAQNARELQILREGREAKTAKENLDIRKKELGISEEKATPGFAFKMGAAHASGALSAIDSAPPSTIEATKGIKLFDPSTLRPVKEGVYGSYGEAVRSGAIAVKGPERKTLESLSGVLDSLDRADKVIDSALPDIDKLGYFDAQKKIQSNRIYMTFHKSTDPNVADFNSTFSLNMLKTIHDLQGRYPSTAEFKLADKFIPDSGDSRQTAHVKVQSLRQLLRDGIKSIAGESDVDLTKGAVDTYMSTGE
jgi:hypothetical protein